jgi:hypothetical protein
MRIRSQLLTFNADPDPAFNFNAYPDPAFTFNADLDSAPHQSDAICDLWSTDPSGLYFKPPRFHFERPIPSRAPFSASEAPGLQCGSRSNFSL